MSTRPSTTESQISVFPVVDTVEFVFIEYNNAIHFQPMLDAQLAKEQDQKTNLDISL